MYIKCFSFSKIRQSEDLIKHLSNELEVRLEFHTLKLYKHSNTFPQHKDITEAFINMLT